MEAIAFGIIVLIWIIASLIKGFKWLLRQTGATPAPPALTAPPPSQAAPTPQNPARMQAPPPSQALPTRTPPLQARSRERQPSAGGPAVPDEATRQGFDRQERELFGSEPTALDTPLLSTPSRSTTAPNSLFGGTDDLVRAIILQEVLGPPLSRRSAPPR
jgi:hypothetical protein